MSKQFMTNAEIMQKAQAEIAGDLYQIRADTSRTEDYKRREIAKAYQRMRTVRDRLVEERDGARRQYQRELEGSIFGAKLGTEDPAAWAISRRDAGDRASKLESPREAQELLARADRTHDEPLARAIAERAYEMGWAEVAEDFLDSRPSLIEKFQELWSQAKPSLQSEVIENFELMAKPAELASLSDYQVDQLASQPDGVSA